MASFLDGLGRKTTLEVFHIGGMYPKAMEALKRSRIVAMVDSGSCFMTSGYKSSGPGFLLFLSLLMAWSIRFLEIQLYWWDGAVSVGWYVSVLGFVRVELGKCSWRSSLSESCVLDVIDPSCLLM